MSNLCCRDNPPRTIRWAFLLSCVSLGFRAEPAAAENAAEPLLAVFDIEVSNAPPLRKTDIAEYRVEVERALTKAGFRIAPHSDIDEALRRGTGESERRCTDQSCFLDIGRAVGAQMSVSTTWEYVRARQVCVLTIRVLDTSTGRTELEDDLSDVCWDAGFQKTTFELAGGVARSLRKRTNAVPRGVLTVDARADGENPLQVEVLVNGYKAGSAGPAPLMIELPVGHYIILLQATGALYNSRYFEVDVPRAGLRLPKTGYIQLKPNFGTVLFSGSPANVDVVVDGVAKAIAAPYSLRLGAGTHRVGIEAPGYQPAPIRDVRVEVSRRVRLDYRLEESERPGTPPRTAAPRSPAEFEPQIWLGTPGVRVLAVEFFATWCRPCMEAVPKWKSLHAEFHRQGLRLVVVATRDPAGGCSMPDWTPDEIICDEDGLIAEKYGARTLPSALLWRWDGRLLVKNGTVEAVARAVDSEVLRGPRVEVEGADANLTRLVRAALAQDGKVTVLADESERKLLRQKMKESFELNRSDKTHCELGRELSPNMILRAQILRSELIVELFSVEDTCLIASSRAAWQPNQPAAAVADAVLSLAKSLRRRAL